MTITVDVKIKEAFFDRASVVSAITAHERKVLSRIGAFVRRRAITDVLRRSSKGKRGRTRAATARPGMPPLVHSRNRHASLRNIQFGLDPLALSVVIGPVGLPDKRLRGSTAQTVPELQEFSGSALVEEYRFPGSDVWNPGHSRNADVIKRKRPASYAAHPFMGPALDKEVAAGNVLTPFTTVRS